jgi:hypothetical protein
LIPCTLCTGRNFYKMPPIYLRAIRQIKYDGSLFIVISQIKRPAAKMPAGLLWQVLHYGQLPSVGYHKIDL